MSFLSAFVKNVGALGVFMPVAIQAAERRNRPVSRYLMPLAFGSLIGGTITQIGTSPNVLISAVRQEVLGQPYHLFDFTPVGLPLSLCRDRVPQRRLAAAAGEPARPADAGEALRHRGLHQRGTAAGRIRRWSARPSPISRRSATAT